MTVRPPMWVPSSRTEQLPVEESEHEADPRVTAPGPLAVDHMIVSFPTVPAKPERLAVHVAKESTAIGEGAQVTERVVFAG